MMNYKYLNIMMNNIGLIFSEATLLLSYFKLQSFTCFKLQIFLVIYFFEIFVNL